jgi:hypothetical protein
MSNLNIFKKIAISFSAVVFSLMLSSSFASALPYTGSTTDASPVPAFNVFSATPGNPLPDPAPSDSEANFLEARVPDTANPDNDNTTPYVENSLSTACTNNELIQMRVYVHNGADAADNDNGTGPSIAHGTLLQVSLPSNESTSLETSAQISANNAATVNDGFTINCTGGKAVELQYVAGSAQQFSFGTNAVTSLPDSVVTTGSPIESQNVSGDMWACWQERVLVLLTVEVVVPTTPPTTTVVTPTTPPKTLVNTGPGNYLGIVTGIASIAGIGYFLRGRKLIRK